MDQDNASSIVPGTLLKLGPGALLSDIENWSRIVGEPGTLALVIGVDVESSYMLIGTSLIKIATQVMTREMQLRWIKHLDQ